MCKAFSWKGYSHSIPRKTKYYLSQIHLICPQELSICEDPESKILDTRSVHHSSHSSASLTSPFLLFRSCTLSPRLQLLPVPCPHPCTQLHWLMGLFCLPFFLPSRARTAGPKTRSHRLHTMPATLLPDPAVSSVAMRMRYLRHSHHLLGHCLVVRRSCYYGFHKTRCIQPSLLPWEDTG